MNLLADKLGTDEEEEQLLEIALQWIPVWPRSISHQELTERMGNRQNRIMAYMVERLRAARKISYGTTHGTYTRPLAEPQ